MNSAVFSPDRRYRYALTRRWNTERQSIAFVMLNPSIADETRSDPTVTRCQRRANDMGYGTLHVLNLFALVSTYPIALLHAADPIGPDNDATIAEVCSGAAMVVCAWGSHKAIGTRAAAVLSMLATQGIGVHALKLNSNGAPSHPLYVPYSCRPAPYALPAG